MIKKNSLAIRKYSPDRIIVLNYNKEEVKEIDLKEVRQAPARNITKTNKGFVIGNIRVAIGWQNGSGLNNPTIRIFLEV